MLVLTRQKNESIMIGDNVELTVVEIRGDKVRLGISAPREIPVFRKEIFDTIQAENLAASAAGETDLKKVEELLREGLDSQSNSENS